METNENKNTMVQNLWDAASTVLRGTFSLSTDLHQEARKTSNNLTLHLKELEKEEQRNPKVSTRKEIIKIRAEKNDIEMKKKT